MSAWPASIWHAAVLRGLDERGRTEIVAAGAIRDLHEGAVLFHARDVAESFFVVAHGELAIHHGDRLVRHVRAGDTLGEEGMLRLGAARAGDAIVLRTARVAEIPRVAFRRAIDRASKDGFASRIERAMRRSAARDRLCSSHVGTILGEREIERLLDAAEHRYLGRGEVLCRSGELAAYAYVIASGLVELHRRGRSGTEVIGCFAPGTVLALDQALGQSPLPYDAVAISEAWVLAVPRELAVEISQRNARLVDDAQTAIASAIEAHRRALANAVADQHPLHDLHRFATAQSLLVIDGDACTRCGQCASSCASAHDDGIVRLVRTDDRIMTRGAKRSLPLLLPRSCHHCTTPSCLADCPTGAIGRGDRGEVVIREELCTGCGNCAKACAWGNIEMNASARAASRLVATKCDLCRGVDDGPACVAACPTEAIARITPRDALPEMRALAGEDEVPFSIARRATWPWAISGTLVGAAIATFRISSREAALASGIAAGVAVATLVSYAARGRVRSRVSAPGMFVAHLATGLVACGVVAAHARGRMPPNAAGALVLAFWATALTGIFGALAYRLIPARISRIAPVGTPDESVFPSLTGKSDAVKLLFARVLGPYAESRFGVLDTIARSVLPAQGERRLRERVEGLAPLRDEDRHAVDALVVFVVSRRSRRAQRVLHFVLRAWTSLHVAMTAALIVLLLVHLVVVWMFR